MFKGRTQGDGLYHRTIFVRDLVAFMDGQRFEFHKRGFFFDDKVEKTDSGKKAFGHKRKTKKPDGLPG
jgi:hypothetical protein